MDPRPAAEGIAALGLEHQHPLQAGHRFLQAVRLAEALAEGFQNDVLIGIRSTQMLITQLVELRVIDTVLDGSQRAFQRDGLRGTAQSLANVQMSGGVGVAVGATVEPGQEEMGFRMVRAGFQKGHQSSTGYIVLMTCQGSAGREEKPVWPVVDTQLRQAGACQDQHKQQATMPRRRHSHLHSRLPRGRSSNYTQSWKRRASCPESEELVPGRSG